jgi:hypothetical protein
MSVDLADVFEHPKASTELVHMAVMISPPFAVRVCWYYSTMLYFWDLLLL